MKAKKEKVINVVVPEGYKEIKEKYSPKEPIILNRVIFDSDKKAAWVLEIEAICNEQGILPEDMVNEWKEMKSREKLYQQNKENDKHIFKKIREEIYKKNIDELNTVSGLSKWQLELRKKKLGI